MKTTIKKTAVLGTKTRVHPLLAALDRVIPTELPVLTIQQFESLGYRCMEPTHAINTGKGTYWIIPVLDEDGWTKPNFCVLHSIKNNRAVIVNASYDEIAMHIDA